MNSVSKAFCLFVYVSLLMFLCTPSVDARTLVGGAVDQGPIVTSYQSVNSTTPEATTIGLKLPQTTLFGTVRTLMPTDPPVKPPSPQRDDGKGFRMTG